MQPARKKHRNAKPPSHKNRTPLEQFVMAKPSIFKRLEKWLQRPLVTIVCVISTLISVPLAIYLYWVSIPSRQIGVVEPPVRSVFLSKEAPASLAVQVNGAPVTAKDVFAVQFVLWNRGNHSIRRENVLEPTVFRCMDQSRIVDAKVLRRTRDLCDVQTTILPDQRSVQVDWKILEPGDGGLIQLVLVGDQNAPIGLEGTIEAGGKPQYVKMSDVTKPAARWSRPDWKTWVVIVLGFGMAAAACWGTIADFKRWRKGLPPKPEEPRHLGSFIFLGLLCSGFILAMIAVTLDAIQQIGIPSALAA